MHIQFAARTVLVTGAASGIGAATAQALASAGASVLVTDINDAAGEAVAGAIRAAGTGNARYCHVDVTDPAQLEAACAEATRHFGALHGIVNNAGRGTLGETPDLALDEWRSVIEIDLNGVFYGCRAAIPHIRAAGGGFIVNVASLSGIRADYGFGPYNAAKAAVINYTRTLALDHAKDRIRVNAVCPGWILTPLTGMTQAVPAIAEGWSAAIPLHRGGTAQEVANAICFLGSDLASYVTGTTLVVDGGLGVSNGQPNIPAILAAMT